MGGRGSRSGQKRKRARSGDNDDDDDGVVARGPRNADTSRLIRSRVGSSPLVVLRPESFARRRDETRRAFIRALANVSRKITPLCVLTVNAEP